MHIREAIGADVGEISELWELLVAHHLSIDPTLPHPTPDGAEKYARLIYTYMGYPEGSIYVAVAADGSIVGYIFGNITERAPSMFVTEQVGNIVDLYVREAHRRQGVGKQLVDAMMTWFAAKTVQTVSWDVVAANEATHAFWRSVGGRNVMVRMQMELGA